MRVSQAAPAAAVVLGLLAAAPVSRGAPAPDGAALYAQRCAKCHDHAAGHVPSREALASRPPSNIVMTLLTGAMRPQASGMSRADAGAIAAFVTAGASADAPRLHPNPCRATLAPLELSSRARRRCSPRIQRDAIGRRPAPDAPRRASEYEE
ncbi:MAG: c-type cytochrome [Steroidobacteraceae bacterium]